MAGRMREIWTYRQALTDGILMTVYLNAIVLLLGSALALMVAASRMSSNRVARVLGRLYVDLFRTLPLLVLLIWLFFVLPVIPLIGMRMSPLQAASVGLSLNLAAFLAEIIRAGVNAVPRVHLEAAKVCGMGRLDTYRYIVAPLALRTMLAPLFGQYLNHIKLSVLASTIAVPELLHTVQTITTETFRPLELYTALAVIFLVLLLPGAWLQGSMEARQRPNAPALPEQVDATPTRGDAAPELPFADGWPTLAPGARIRVTDLAVHYAHRCVLSGLSFQIEPGKVLALLGPNGSGKTTTLRALAALTPPTAGTVAVEGTPPNNSRLSVGYVFQEYEPWPHLSVAENLTIPLRTGFRLPAEQVQHLATEWLRFLGLGERAEMSAQELSGGQRQRLALARALCFRPSVLLLDEPTSAIDFRWALLVHETIRRLASLGVAIVLVSHSIQVVARLADTVVFLDDGKAKETGPAAEVLGHPRTTDFAAFLRAA